MAGCTRVNTPFVGSRLPEEKPRIDVIVRTLLSKTREREIIRALDSIQNLSSMHARPIVVVNGDRYDPTLLKTLQRRQGVVLHFQADASAGRAIGTGRRLVTAPYFMFLDDDDQLVAAGMESFSKYILDHSDWDVLVTNGYFSRLGERRPMYLDLQSHAIHPLRSLLSESWVCAGATIFRSESISAAFLDMERNHQEWTFIAFRLVMEEKRIAFMDAPTVVYHDTGGSASKLIEHQEEALDLLEQMSAHPRVDRETRRLMERKYRNMLHVLALQHWQRGARRKAWIYHLRSMRQPFTFKYLLFSRKLLIPARRAQLRQQPD